MKNIYTKEVFNILPQNIRELLECINNIDTLQEIRIKVNKPIILVLDNREKIIDYYITADELKVIMQRTSNFSIYAFEEELKQGFITISGGHRVGICGKCVMEDNRVKTIKDIASVNIRISRQVLGCSNKLLPYIVKNGQVMNTIIISPPKCGKTTILRDIARNLSNGIGQLDFKGHKVCIIDERSELAACCDGIPQMDVGIRTDVLDNCFKNEGIMMAIRSMSPDVVICDEIGTYKDMESILIALSCGISLITTIHGKGIEDFQSRLVFKDLINNKVFERAIILNNRAGVGTLEKIYNMYNGELIWRNPNV